MPQIWKMAEMNLILSSMLFLSHRVYHEHISWDLQKVTHWEGWRGHRFTEHLTGDRVGGLAGQGGWRTTPIPTIRTNLDNMLSTDFSSTQERTEVIAQTASEKLEPDGCLPGDLLHEQVCPTPLRTGGSLG